MFVSGEELSSGAQRIHVAELLEERAKKCGLDVNTATIGAYIEVFRYYFLLYSYISSAQHKLIASLWYNIQVTLTIDEGSRFFEIHTDLGRIIPAVALCK